MDAYSWYYWAIRSEARDSKMVVFSTRIPAGRPGRSICSGSGKTWFVQGHADSSMVYVLPRIECPRERFSDKGNRLEVATVMLCEVGAGG